jgi:O-antigen ligase
MSATQPAAEVAPDIRRSDRSRPAALPLFIGLGGLLTGYLGFEQGGFFAGTTAAAAVIVAVGIILRITLADHPLRAFGPAATVAAAALAGLAIWTLLSQGWSDAPARALLEFDRTLLYLLILVAMATVGRTARRVSGGLWAFALAATIVCLGGLGSRILPNLVSAPVDIESDRLSWPLTYWNALGLLAALALVACTHLATSERQPAAARVAGAAAVPGLAVTLYFTFSRGAIAVAIVALVVYVLLARPRGLLGGFLAVGPTAAFAVAVAYGADLLAKENPTAPIASGQASRVAWVTAAAMLGAGVLRLLALPLDARLARIDVPRRARRVALVGGAAATGVAVLALGLALDAPNALERQYDRFVEGRTIESGGDLRDRLINPANNGRLDGWQVAADGVRAEPLRGNGAGTFEQLWARERPSQFMMVDAHSLYLDTLSDLGIVGMALLGVALLTIVGTFVARVRGEDRALYAALVAMAVAWLIHSGLDWDWEMPAVTLWLFAMGGLVLGRSPGERPALSRPARPLRVALGFAFGVLAVVPAQIYLSQQALDGSVRAFKHGDCATAVDDALRANDVLSVRPEPFEILGYCDVRLGKPSLGVRAMEEAVERDPREWRLHYGLALTRAAAGQSPRAAARRALRLNPREEMTRDAVAAFRTDDPQKWRRRALSARLPID